MKRYTCIIYASAREKRRDRKPGTAIIREVPVPGNFWFVLFTLVEAKERAQAAVNTREAHEGEGEQTG